MRIKPKRDARIFASVRNGKPEILIYDDIGPSWLGMIGADTVKDKLDGFGDVDEVDVRLNSQGGSVFQGWAIYNLLSQHSAKINIFIDGMAASIASIVAMAGDSVKMAENSRAMVHNAWGIVIGNAGEMRSAAEFLASIDDDLAATYAARTKLGVEDWSEKMEAETFFGASDALEWGFADEIIERKAVAASTRLDAFNCPFAGLTPENWKPAPLNWEAIVKERQPDAEQEDAPEDGVDVLSIEDARNMLKTIGS